MYSTLVLQLTVASSRGGILFFVMPTGKCYSVHAHLAAHYSDHFLEVLNLKENVQMVTRCSSNIANKKSIELFVGWVYSRSADSVDDELSSSFVSLHSNERDEDLARAWIYGCKIEAPGFQNAVLQLLDRKFEEATYETVANLTVRVWDAVPSESQLQCYLVAMLCNTLSEREMNDIVQELGRLPGNIRHEAMDLLRYLIRIMNETEPGNFRRVAAVGVEDFLEEPLRI